MEAFFVRPVNHIKQLFGGCPRCKESNGERLVRTWLEKNNFKKDKDFFQEFRIKECKDKKTLPFDFYLPKKRMMIEFQGKQHYKQYKLFGRLEQLRLTKRHDEIKREFCKKNNYLLLEVPYNCKNINNLLKENIIDVKKNENRIN